MPDFSVPLAIVIPAYKRRFFAEALESIARQTDQRFHLYVCDDGSPEDLHSLCENILPSERITYRRFEPNMGARHLVRHWNRSVALATEPWIWLFSDDDVMEPDCVAAFLAALAQPADAETHVYRFDTLMIDAESRIIQINAPHPPQERAVEFAYHRLALQRLSFAPDHIFRRAAFEQHGGFVELPLGLGSDDASWITFTGDQPIRALPGPRVHWRLSGQNISSSRTVDPLEKQKAYLEFAAWMARRFANESPLPPGLKAAFTIPQLAARYYHAQLRNHPSFFGWKAWRGLPPYVSARVALSPGRVRATMLDMNAAYLLGRCKRAVLSLLRISAG